MSLSPERRASLARKGLRLYEKSCGGDAGRSDCALSFARHHRDRGDPEVVQDLLNYVHGRVLALRLHDPEGRLPAAAELAECLTKLLNREGTSASHA